MFFRGFSSKKAVLDSKNGRTDPPRGGVGEECNKEEEEETPTQPATNIFFFCICSFVHFAIPTRKTTKKPSLFLAKNHTHLKKKRGGSGDLAGRKKGVGQLCLHSGQY